MATGMAAKGRFFGSRHCLSGGMALSRAGPEQVLWWECVGVADVVSTGGVVGAGPAARGIRASSMVLDVFRTECRRSMRIGSDARQGETRGGLRVGKAKGMERNPPRHQRGMGSEATGMGAIKGEKGVIGGVGGTVRGSAMSMAIIATFVLRMWLVSVRRDKLKRSGMS